MKQYLGQYKVWGRGRGTEVQRRVTPHLPDTWEGPIRRELGAPRSARSPGTGPCCLQGETPSPGCGPGLRLGGRAEPGSPHFSPTPTWGPLQNAAQVQRWRLPLPRVSGLYTLLIFMALPCHGISGTEMKAGGGGVDYTRGGRFGGPSPCLDLEAV